MLASDGDWNEGEPPVEAAVRLRLANVPVFAVPVGSPQRLPDVELLSLDAPTFGVVGKTVRIPFTIESSLPREYTTTVVLKASDGEEVTKEVRIAPQGRTSDCADLEAERDRRLHAHARSAASTTSEAVTDNNQLTAPIAIREEKLRVLVVESYPRWEYRYLRNALSRDPGVELSCLLFHPGLTKSAAATRTTSRSSPRTSTSSRSTTWCSSATSASKTASSPPSNAGCSTAWSSIRPAGWCSCPAGRGGSSRCSKRSLTTFIPSCSMKASPAAGARGRRATSS